MSRLHGVVVILVLGWGLYLGSPHAAASDAESRPEPAAEKGAEQDAAPKAASPRKKGGDLSSCRRDARGLDGPERARFMTECLRKRD